LIVASTNAHASKKLLEKAKNGCKKRPALKNKDRKWHDVDLSDIYAYFAIRIYMGYTRLPSIGEYWNTNPKACSTHLSIRSALGKNRFEDIDAAFYVSNPPDNCRVWDKVFNTVSVHYIR